MKLSRPQLKVLSAAIYHHFKGLDNPAADEIYVPLEAIKADDEPNTYQATVRFVIDYCGRKVHSVRILFSVDPVGRFLANTWKYV